MIESLLYILFLLILFIFFTFLVSLINERKLTRKTNNKYNPSDVLSFDLTREEFDKALNFMLMYNIIDGKQYNEIMVRGSSFLR